MVIYGKPFLTKRYKKDYKRMKKRVSSMQPLFELLRRLMNERLLPKDKDHALKGAFFGLRECHVKADWVLLYEVKEGNLILHRTGKHSDIFKKRY